MWYRVCQITTQYSVNFCLLSGKIYTGQKNLHGRRPPRPRQLSGMCRWGGTRDGTRVGNRGVVGVVLGSVLWVVIGEVLGVLLGFLRV